MKLIDLHCDTLMRLHALEKEERRKGQLEKKELLTVETPWSNRGQADISRMLDAGYAMQCFACFTDAGEIPILGSHYEDVLAMTDLMHRTVLEHSDQIAFAKDFAEYKKNQDEGKLSVMLTVEEGGILDGHPDRLDRLYEEGIRMITLTWNYPNCIGFPNKNLTYQNEGLTGFGREVLEQMDELGIVADVSHMSDGGFMDVWKYGKRPFLATHSNARSIAGHPRNLTDEMLKKLADKGGITGLNFFGPFVNDNGESTLDGLVCQARHILDVGGRNVLCIGSDFDGMTGEQELKGCQDMKKLVEAFEAAGFTIGEIESICWKNAEDFMERYWG